MSKAILLQNRYQLQQVIGQGSMGVVHLAYDTLTQSQLAIKVLRRFNEQDGSEAMLRFRRESELVSRLSHPNIIKLHGLVEENNQLYLLMEYFAGTSLKQMIPSLSLSEKVALTQSIAKTLAYIHEQGIIHRDLKPDNILVSNTTPYAIKVIDFGLSHLIDKNEILKKGSVAGTLHYISPEQTGMLKRNVDERSDLYSLGVTLYELLTGETPFRDADPGKLIYKHLAHKPAKPSTLSVEVTPLMDAIVAKLLSKEPAERYQSAKGLAVDLQEYQRAPQAQNFTLDNSEQTKELQLQLSLTGREREIALLNEKNACVMQNNAQTILVLGRSGTGKSKLIEAFKEQLPGENHLYLDFKCSTASRNIPFALFGEIFKKLFAQGVKPDLLQEFQQTEQDACLYLAKITPLFQVASVQKEAGEEETKKQKDLLFAAVLKFWQWLTQRSFKPIIFMDDLQWADEDSLELFTYLSRALKNLPVLLLAGMREEE
jgi:serine/threonine protein kinase